jgi:hypothetical protein
LPNGVRADPYTYADVIDDFPFAGVSDSGGLTPTSRVLQH